MKFVRAFLGLLMGLIACIGLGAGCLDRPVVEASPKTSNEFVGQVAQTAVTKIDLLFMIDNSASMSDKQEILKAAVPVLLTRLTAPICVDRVTQEPTHESASGGCKIGEPEFTPISDIHIGVVTSSLGAHGGLLCKDGPGSTPNDRAHLLGTVRPAGQSGSAELSFDVAKTWNNSGFLAWDANQTDQPVPGTRDPGALQTSFQNMIAAAGEQGCGLEASLESWYRFLVDPEPPLQVTKSTTTPTQTVRGSALVTHADGSTSCEGCDLEILAQRKAFLRSDSLLAIVMLSDENDCSIRDDGVGWFVGGAPDGDRVQRMPRATSACAKDPNDPCCRSCADTSRAPSGCVATADDSECKQAPALDTLHDSTNLRCYQQKQRFGFDALYPVSRYVDALTKPKLTLDSDHDAVVPNPLFAADSSGGLRDASRIFLAGIVGVPWQDIADEASLSGPGLTYLTAEELTAKDRWAALIGTPDASPPVPPSDPFMIESPSPRHGENPVTHTKIVAETATHPDANPINGHEQNVPLQDDLQYACTFPLAHGKECPAGDVGCDCGPNAPRGSSVTDRNSPLCQPPQGGPAGTTQYQAKAYPGTRELEVLKGLKSQGIVASICPKVTVSPDPASDPNYGYNPAVAAIIARLKLSFSGKCLPRRIDSDPVTHQVECQVIEARRGVCDCGGPGRTIASPTALAAVQRELREQGACGTPGQPPCESFCGCEIVQQEGPSLDACRRGDATDPGFCYIDDPSSPLLAKCPATEKHLLRFVSGPTAERAIPAPGTIAFIACLGAPL